MFLEFYFQSGICRVSTIPFQRNVFCPAYHSHACLRLPCCAFNYLVFTGTMGCFLFVRFLFLVIKSSSAILSAWFSAIHRVEVSAVSKFDPFGPTDWNRLIPHVGVAGRSRLYPFMPFRSCGIFPYWPCLSWHVASVL